eukprot:TRINITY_DN8238_c0_g1_i1.p1 TRINITY_DN8238_c0_g1~~TRINITY_DN8238_c0_g1_i1.p1  ORF type:complete len:807 (+),score=186.48 TRINITY_DN8238_c0_g1_i1:325-2745(+)
MGAVVSELAERDTKQLELFKTIECWLFGPGFNSSSEETLNAYFFVLAFNPKSERIFPWKSYLLIVTSHRLIVAKEKNKDLALKAIIQYNEISEMFFAPDFQLVKISFADKTCAYLNTAQKSLAPELVKIISANMERYKLEESACGGQRTKLPLPLGLNPQGLNANEKKDLGRSVHGLQLPSTSARTLQRDDSNKRLVPKPEDKRRSVRNLISGAFSEKQSPTSKREPPAQLSRNISTLGLNRSAALLLTTQMAHLTPVFKILQSLNLQEPQLYSGQVDLLAVMTTLKSRTQLPTEERASYLIDFSFPDDTVFGGLSKRLYKVSNKSTAGQTLTLLFNKLKINNGESRFSLSTDAGRILEETKTLASYGLGILFLTWQLKIVPKPPVTPNLIVDIHLPEGAQFLGQQKKTIKLPNTAKISEVVSILFERLKLPGATEYELKTMEFLEMNPEDLVSEHRNDDSKFSFIITKAGQKKLPETDASAPAETEVPTTITENKPRSTFVQGPLRASSFISAGLPKPVASSPLAESGSPKVEKMDTITSVDEIDLRTKIEAELRASLEAELRRKIEAEVRLNLEKELRENIEKQILAKIDENTRKLSAPASTTAAVPQRRSVVLGGNRSSSLGSGVTPMIGGNRRSASFDPSALAHLDDSSNEELKSPKSAPPPTPTPTPPQTEAQTPPTPAPEAPLSEEQQKINKLVERMTSLSQEKRDEISNLLMMLESEEKAKEEEQSGPKNLTFIKMRTFGTQLKSQLGEGKGNLRAVQPIDRPLIQEDNQFIKMLMKRYENMHINPDDVEDLAGSDDDW